MAPWRLGVRGVLLLVAVFSSLSIYALLGWAVAEGELSPSLLWVKGLDEVVRCISWSPDEGFLAVAASSDGRGRVLVYGVGSGEVVWTSGVLGGEVYCVSWSPSGDLIVAGGRLGRLVAFAPNGSVVWEVPFSGTVYSIAWGPRGDVFAVVARLYYYDVVAVYDRSGALLWEKRVGYCRVAAWSPDGGLLAVGAGGPFSGRLVVLDSEGNVVWETRDLGGGVYAVAWSPNGDAVAFGGRVGGIVAYSRHGERLWTIDYRGLHVLSLSWSPSGAYIAAGLGLDDGSPTSPGRIVVFTVDGETVWDSGSLRGDAYSVSWSPSGRALAVGLGSGQLMVYAFKAQGGDGEKSSQPQAAVTVTVEKTVTRTVTVATTVSVSRVAERTITVTVPVEKTVEAIREVTRTLTETETVTRTVTHLIANTLTMTTTAWKTVVVTRTVTVDPSPAAVGIAALVALVGVLNLARARRGR